MLMLSAVRPSDLEKVLALYERSFPENERSPLEPMLEDKTGSAEILSVHRDQTFCGFVCILKCDDLVHIIYFAVEETMRGQGTGSSILHLVQQRYPDMRIIVDIEQPKEYAENNAQRIRRKAFYLRCGYQENNFEYNWRETDYTVLSSGGGITHEEFRMFWKHLIEIMPQARIY